jgi:hypothetical protein
MPKRARAEVTALAEPTNGGFLIIDSRKPYVARITIVGNADLIFHRWNVEAVAEKAAAAKGSAAKKKDDVASYVYRDEQNWLCLPGEYLRQSVIHAAKYRQDPRSPRKSAMDLFKAGIICLTVLAPLGPDRKTKWDYEDARRVTVQRQGVTRVRPAFRSGWTAVVEFAVLLPEYIGVHLLHETLNDAGRLVGLGDNRPTYGRFLVQSFDKIVEP